MSKCNKRGPEGVRRPISRRRGFRKFARRAHLWDTAAFGFTSKDKPGKDIAIGTMTSARIAPLFASTGEIADAPNFATYAETASRRVDGFLGKGHLSGPPKKEIADNKQWPGPSIISRLGRGLIQSDGSRRTSQCTCQRRPGLNNNMRA